MQFRAADKLTVRADAFNVLGWSDKNLNKRNYLDSFSDHRSEAAALAVSASYRF